MAEAVVSIALKTFRDFLLEEGRFLAGVRGEVKALQTQLKEINCFLQDADRRRHESKIIFNWIVEIRDLAYRAEAAIEIHAAGVSSRRRRGLRQLVRRCFCYSLHQLGSEISQIKSDLGRLTENLRGYGIRNIIGESSAANDWSRKTFPDFEMGECFVGMEDELKQLLSLLVDDKEHRVISVWGMGGSGKTTIARKVYNHIKNSSGFDSFAWVCISQQCQIRSVLEDVLKQLISKETSLQQMREDVSSLSETELIERLCKIQREKRCLIVVDDLWKLCHWDGFKHAFLVHNLQSKILITTREKEVAEIGFPLEHGLLNMGAALELLKKKSFPHNKIPDEENFENIGKEMVKKCGYLPLAICLLGGVLRKKKSMMEWKEVNKNMNALIYRDEKEIDGVLNLSYENLPFYLKPCFLYMGIFKEDESIQVGEVYRMWVAQGMISYENKDEPLTEIAELYLSELASRSIVQVEMNVVSSKGRIYDTCKLHDVVRELCLKLGKREEFGVQIFKYQGGKLTTFQGESSSHIKIRHLAIHFETEVQPDELTITCVEDTSKHLRSLRILNHVNSDAVEFPPQSIVDFQKFKFLREVVIVGFKFAGRKLPRGITELVHLRRLHLQKCEVDELPPSIGNLVYLEFLNLRESRNIGVPNVFKKMFQLKHLQLPSYDKEKIDKYRVRLDEGVDELENLYCLDSRVHELECMGRMKNLQRFSAYIHDNESLSSMMNAISTKWNKLVYCGIYIKEGCTSEEGLKNALTCPNIDVLWIEVKLGKVVAECGISELMSSKLTVLVLSGSEIEDDSMGILGKLPYLTELYLRSRSFVGEEMRCLAFSFPHLKKLVLQHLPKLREWRVEAGAMPLLSELYIDGCDRLEMVPDGLSGISTLRTLDICGMPELGKRVSSPSGEDFHKVRHVPSILVYD